MERCEEYEFNFHFVCNVKEEHLRLRKFEEKYYGSAFIMMSSLLLTLMLFMPAVFADYTGGASGRPRKVVCYLGSWANYRHGEGKFVIEDIDSRLCTHLVYGFAKLSEDNRIAPYDPYLDLKENWGLGAYHRFNDLKRTNPGLKTLIAIGGWNEGSFKYSRMAADAGSRKVFVQSCLEFLAKHGFDGLDLDWEYPANRGGQSYDKQNFVALIRELREAFEPHTYLLTAAIGAGQKTVDSAYDIPALGKYLDFINLMTYDFHGGWDTTTGHNAPLYARPNESEDSKKLNVDYAVKYLLSQGCPADKLILGMPLYGRGFTLQDPNNNGLDAPVTGKSNPGEYTQEAGYLGYNEICKKLKNEKGWTMVFQSEIQAPYAFRDTQWIGYDNQKSIYLKAQYVQKINLGGAMVWSLETDDFHGHCHHGRKFPLLRALNEGLERPVPPDSRSTPHPNSIPDDISTASSSDERTSPVEVTESNDLLPCPHSGYFRHPRDCKLFYYCQPKSEHNKENLVYMFRCSEGTVFSQTLRVCVFPESEPECL